MAALSAVPRLEAALNDKEPVVVLAAAHSLFLLGQPEKAYQIDYEVLRGDRKALMALSRPRWTGSKTRKLWQ